MNLSELPKKIAIFPLSNAIFFPRTILPLNIFEKRYLQLIEDCIKGHKLFGMVQPKLSSNSIPEVYKVGCLGKIINCNETNDKRFIIDLSGVTRFKIKEELTNNKLYREFSVEYDDFIDDLNKKKIKEGEYDTSQLLNKIKILFKRRSYLIDWVQLEKLNFDEFINTICMISPFSVEEKQKLIETIKLEDKINTIDKIINFNLLDNLNGKTMQ